MENVYDQLEMTSRLLPSGFKAFRRTRNYPPPHPPIPALLVPQGSCDFSEVIEMILIGNALSNLPLAI
jgi:hypothetical protein